jgi:2-polyprenyl-6-methoxyphenol hydroxylase-like FAD-dependent oxidoreductase
MRRSALLSMLAEGMPEELAQYGANVQSLNLRQGRPTVLLTDGTTLAGSLIVGADGVHSIVRREAFGPDAGAGHALLAKRSWRFMAPNPGIRCWTVWASAEGMIHLMPVSETEVYGWAAITSPKLIGDSVKALVEMSAEFPRYVQDAVIHAAAKPEGPYHSPLEEVRLEQWHLNGVVLIGDAAHATAPVWAQGAALGMEDAISLGGLLASGKNIPDALAEFEALRRPRVTHVQRMTDAMSKAAKLPPLLRKLLLPFVGPRKYQQTYGPLRHEA